MFKGESGRSNMLKIFGVVLACLLVLIILRITIFNKIDSLPDTEEKAQTVIELNNVVIPEYDGTEPVVEINKNETYFTDDDVKTEYFVFNSELDTNYRPQTAAACLDAEHLVTEENTESMSDMKPSGWKEAGIYFKTHIIGWELSGSNTIQNLISGTEYLDQYTLPEYENQIIEYLVSNNKNHVMYRVTPYYIEKEDACRGLLLEAYSVEDDGQLEFCVFIYNVQPGTDIDYSDGTYHMYATLEESLGTEE